MMDVLIHFTPSVTAVLGEPSNFTSFKVVVHGAPDGQPSLAPVAEWLDAEHVAVPTDAVRRLAGETARTPAWGEGFAAMLAYADSKGWIVGDAIRGHVERQP